MSGTKDDSPLPGCSEQHSQDNRQTSAVAEAIEQIPKKKKRVGFNSVTVYYFDREQGSTCIPSNGGCTLGMSAHHSEAVMFSIDEHAIESYRLDGTQQSKNAKTYKPYEVKQRRSILKMAGVQVNPGEEVECNSIRDSRDNCGCDCQDFCDPDTCSCIQSGINCQVDYPNFPCSCSKENCQNPAGRLESDHDDIRAQVCHTLKGMKKNDN
ncbi:unnamed protein product [Ceutorhynchus assimilis]|uniref:Cysteine/serine-rich nuclear protein N-terminal domain-containing protein n=1 Tax=Ceutorhynchus assimilis TaxID=467358 RepID=A0A9N9M9B3_9CUCU|nr:unnamed protein product [Ceutorhynchus assimilis]